MHYKKHLKGKVVYCNCDDMRVSNFVKYFRENFDELGLKKLYATCYIDQSIDLFEPREIRKPILYEKNHCKSASGFIDTLAGDGDFRSRECIDIMKEADVVITNPPFSLWREYISLLFEYEKKFLIVGTLNAFKNMRVFRKVLAGEIWLGWNNDIKGFEVPDEYGDRGGVRVEDGKNIASIGCSCWCTNLEHGKERGYLALTRKYVEGEYKHYHNYDAIHVEVLKDIPMDYEGVMGVPITFLYHYNPDQFELVGKMDGGHGNDIVPGVFYERGKQINMDGTTENAAKLNTSLVLHYDAPPDSVYYTSNNHDGYFLMPYERILVRNKRIRS